jgi:hypothetical protein
MCSIFLPSSFNDENLFLLVAAKYPEPRTYGRVLIWKVGHYNRKYISESVGRGSVVGIDIHYGWDGPGIELPIPVEERS